MFRSNPTNADEVVEKIISKANENGANLETLVIVLTVKSVNSDVLEFNGRAYVDLLLTQVDLREESESGNSKTQNIDPHWNGKELWFEDRAIKRFRRPARNQQTILAVFQEEGWPKRIDNPIPANEQCDAQSRLHDTIKSLNRNHIPDPSPIRFRGDGTGTGVIWEIVSERGLAIK